MNREGGMGEEEQEGDRKEREGYEIVREGKQEARRIGSERGNE